MHMYADFDAMLLAISAAFSAARLSRRAAHGPRPRGAQDDLRAPPTRQDVLFARDMASGASVPATTIPHRRRPTAQYYCASTAAGRRQGARRCAPHMARAFHRAGSIRCARANTLAMVPLADA